MTLVVQSQGTGQGLGIDQALGARVPAGKGDAPDVLGARAKTASAATRAESIAAFIGIWRVFSRIVEAILPRHALCRFSAPDFS